jgi:hypothetical protein
MGDSPWESSEPFEENQNQTSIVVHTNSMKPKGFPLTRLEYAGIHRTDEIFMRA